MHSVSERLKSFQVAVLLQSPSAADDPLKELLTALAKAVQSAAEALPQEAGMIIGDLDALVSEATKAHRSTVLKMFGQQLRDVASRVTNSSVGAAVTTALNGVMGYFGFSV